MSTRTRILFPLMTVLLAACSGKEDEPAPDEQGEEELTPWTPEQIAYSTMVNNFFTLTGTDDNGNVYSPSKGIAIDEARPSERSIACESYEDALQGFEFTLPDSENASAYIRHTDNGITVDLGNLGKVSFSPASGEGVVAKAEIRLKDAPFYTLVYRNESSFGDNFSPDQNLYNYFHPGDLVQFTCPERVITNPYDEDQTTETGSKEAKVWKWDTCNSRNNAAGWHYGVVIDASAHSVTVFTNHSHFYSKYDEKKKYFHMYYKLVSAEGLKKIYNSWHENLDSFMNTYNHNQTTSGIEHLARIMLNGVDYYDYVCVEGNDFERHRTLYAGRKCWYSKQKLTKVSDLKNGNFYTKYDWYAYRDKLLNAYNTGYFSLIEFNRQQADKIKVIYPKY